MKIFIPFFPKSSTPSEQEDSFLSVVPQKVPEIWPSKVWYYCGIVLRPGQYNTHMHRRIKVKQQPYYCPLSTIINCCYGVTASMSTQEVQSWTSFLLWYRLRHYTIGPTPHCLAQGNKTTNGCMGSSFAFYTYNVIHRTSGALTQK